MFLELLLDKSLSQLIYQATRPTLNSILDILIASSQNLIEIIQSVPDISDQLEIIFDANLKPHIPKKPNRKIFQFHKVGNTSLRMKAKAVLCTFIKSNPTKMTLILTGVVLNAFKTILL